MSALIKIDTTANRLKIALKQSGKKQVDLANETGIDKGSISHYISGKYEPKQSALYEIGRVLDVSEMWLAGYDVPMERPLFQKENDELVDMTLKLKNEKRFRQLFKKLTDLNPEQLEGLMKLMNIPLD